MIAINLKVSLGVTIIIFLLVFPWIYPNAIAQNNTTLTPEDKFTIPLYNGTVSFAVNGTYSKATFENDSWTFTNLALVGSHTLQNFTVSAQNSNVTILSYLALNFTRQSSRLRYSVEGQGKQVFNFGQGTTGGKFSGIDWSVITGNSTFLAEGAGWTISPNGTIVVSGISGNVSVIHWGFFDSTSFDSNLPFYQQHSIAIATAVSLAVAVAIAVVVKVRNSKSPSNKQLEKNAQAKKQSPALKYSKEEAQK